MNILVLNYEFPPIGGGGASVSYDISKRLAERGHNVYVVTMGYKNLPEDEDIDGMHIHRVKCLRKQAFVCHPWEQLTYIISAIVYLNKYLKSNKCNVVHAHFIIPTGVVAWYLKKRYGLQYVLTAHGSDVLGHNNKRFGFLYKLLIRPWQGIVKNSAYTIALSEHLKKLICKNIDGIYGENKVKIITNGIDTSLYYSSDKEKAILLMGRIQETKGMQDVLKVLTPELLGDWKVRIVGDGPFRKELEKIATDNGINNNVFFYGWLEARSKEQLEILASSSIFVSGSYFENSPITLLEAYSSGCNVVVSDIKAHKELMGDKAVYFDVSDAETIKHAILQSMELFNESIEVDADSIRSFDWNTKIEQYERLLQEENITYK